MLCLHRPGGPPLAAAHPQPGCPPPTHTQSHGNPQPHAPPSTPTRHVGRQDYALSKVLGRYALQLIHSPRERALVPLYLCHVRQPMREALVDDLLHVRGWNGRGRLLGLVGLFRGWGQPRGAAPPCGTLCAAPQWGNSLGFSLPPGMSAALVACTAFKQL